MERLVTKECNIDLIVDFDIYSDCVDISVKYMNTYTDDIGQLFELGDSVRVFEVTQEEGEEYFKTPLSIFTNLCEKEIRLMVEGQNNSLEEDELDEFYIVIDDGDLISNLVDSFKNLKPINKQ